MSDLNDAAKVLRERAAMAEAALADCADNAPWDSDHCRQTRDEANALADLLDCVEEQVDIAKAAEHLAALINRSQS